MNFKSHLDKNPLFNLLAKTGEQTATDCYIVGGYVRDLILNRHNVDIDILVVGSGIEFAKAFAANIGSWKKVNYYVNFGTAQVRYKGMEVEFVGARKESYHRKSRNPIVEEGTLADDIARRDFCVNAMTICLYNRPDNRPECDPVAREFGDLVDIYNGMNDIANRTLRTPLDPDITFSDDPLRMLRAVRFASQLGFSIYPQTLEAIKRNANRLEIITVERITTEFNKIMLSPRPSQGIALLHSTGLLNMFFPELEALTGREFKGETGHKDVFEHTLKVLDAVALADDGNLWLRWAALLHDIGKPATKKWDEHLGWTFHNHNFIGKIMVDKIFHRLKLPLGETVKYVKKLVDLHMRPINLCEEGVTDSAIRRLLFDAGNDIDHLMILCRCDLTSSNRQKVKRIHDNYALLAKKLVEVEEKDRVRNFQPPVRGEEIMHIFGLAPCSTIGTLKDAIKEAILEGEIENSREAALQMLFRQAENLGLKAINAPFDLTDTKTQPTDNAQ